MSTTTDDLRSDADGAQVGNDRAPRLRMAGLFAAADDLWRDGDVDGAQAPVPRLRLTGIGAALDEEVPPLRLAGAGAGVGAALRTGIAAPARPVAKQQVAGRPGYIGREIITRRRRPGAVLASRLVRDVSSVLMIAGLLLVLDAGVTLLWQEPVTAVIATIRRAELNQRYLSYKSVPLSAAQRAALQSFSQVPARIAFLARQEARQVPTGAAIGKIVIRKIGVSYDIIEGTDTLSLEKGPGHYPGTAFPGLGQTVGIAGHRTTYLAPFHDINELTRGDLIQVEMPYADFTYRVQYDKIVLPTAVWVTRDVGYERLVLSACNPLYSAAQRIIVFARLAAVTPSRQALAGA